MPDDKDPQGDAPSPGDSSRRMFDPTAPDADESAQEPGAAGPESDVDADALAEQVLAEAGLAAGGDSAPDPGNANAPAVTPDPPASKPSSILSQEDLDAILSQAGSGSPSPGGGFPGLSDPDDFGAEPMDLPDFDTGDATGSGSLEMLKDISLNVKIELGRTQMYIEDILKLSAGSVVELEKLAGDPVDILVNDRLVAKGEVLILNDNFCVRIGEIVSPDDRLDAKTV